MSGGTIGTERPTRARHGILALIATGTLINYLDRTILGIAAPALSHDLAINPAMMGVVFSAFSWSYAAAQIPGGAFLDRFGSKVTYGLSLVGWSLMTLLHALASGVGMLIGLRLALGVAEAPCFPANSRIVATWFPQSERAFATGVYTVGEYVGLAFLSPLLFAMLAHWGWHSLFVFGGVLGVLFAMVWWRAYREPADHPGLGAAERAHILAGGGLIDGAGPVRIDWRDAGRLLRHRQMWGICIGQFAGNSTLVFFLTWFPSYLATERQMDWIRIGWLAVLPFIAASVGVLAGGFWSDHMLRRGATPTLARKLPIVTGLLLASTIIAANYVENDGVVIAIMSLAFFAQGMAALGWTLVSDIAPKGMLGVTGGVFNLAANLAGILTPLVIGAIVASTGSFVGALAYVGALALLGAFAYIVILGDVKRIELA